MIGNTYQGIQVDCVVDDGWVTWTIPNVQRVYFVTPGTFWVAPNSIGIGHINIDFYQCEVELVNKDFYTVRVARSEVSSK